MRWDFRHRLPPLTEAVPDSAIPEPSHQRLTRFGQLMLASGIGLLGLIAYVTTWNIGHAAAEKLQFCPILTPDHSPTTSLESLSLISSGDTANMLLWNYKLNQELIKELTVATRRQRLLLNQQVASLTIRLSRQCSLVRYYRIQAGSLTVVSTGAAGLLLITGLVRMPRGMKDISRSEQAIGISALSLLVLSIGYLTLGGQQAQFSTNWSYHQRGSQLFSLIRSSLANQQLLVPPDPGTTTATGTAAPPLKSPNDVAVLVSRIDAWLLSVDHGSVRLNNDFARQTFNHLFQNQDQDQPTNPLMPTP